VGVGPRVDDLDVATRIAELTVDRHIVPLTFTNTGRRGQSALALISY
jgi:hypothetical protein